METFIDTLSLDLPSFRTMCPVAKSWEMTSGGKLEPIETVEAADGPSENQSQRLMKFLPK